MPRPLFNPRAAIGGKSLIAATIGLTATASAIERRVHVVALGQITSGVNRRNTVFRAPPSGARILTAYLNAGTAMYHAAAEADTWVIRLSNRSANLSLIKNAASLSGITLTMTGFKVLPMNNGNSTLNANSSLQLQLSISGTPQTMVNAAIFLEWVPATNI